MKFFPTLHTTLTLFPHTPRWTGTAIQNIQNHRVSTCNTQVYVFVARSEGILYVPARGVEDEASTEIGEFYFLCAYPVLQITGNNWWSEIKSIHITVLGGKEISEVSHFLHSRLIDCGVSLTHLPRFTSQKPLLLLISVRNYVNSRDYYSWKD
jgi:hypothetical protein